MYVHLLYMTPSWLEGGVAVSQLVQSYASVCSVCHSEWMGLHFLNVHILYTTYKVGMTIKCPLCMMCVVHVHTVYALYVDVVQSTATATYKIYCGKGFEALSHGTCSTWFVFGHCRISSNCFCNDVKSLLRHSVNSTLIPTVFTHYALLVL